jgi:hypothetical protein
VAELLNFTHTYGEVQLNECSLVHTVTTVCFSPRSHQIRLNCTDTCAVESSLVSEHLRNIHKILSKSESFHERWRTYWITIYCTVQQHIHHSLKITNFILSQFFCSYTD